MEGQGQRQKQWQQQQQRRVGAGVAEKVGVAVEAAVGAVGVVGERKRGLPRQEVTTRT